MRVPGAKHAWELRVGRRTTSINGIEYNIAGCCNPIAGDVVSAYVTSKNDLWIDKTDCINAPDLRRQEQRILQVARKSDKQQEYDVPLYLHSDDRPGMLSHVLGVLTDANVTLRAAEAVVDEDTAIIHIGVSVHSRKQLTALAKELRRINGVREVIESGKGHEFREALFTTEERGCDAVGQDVQQDQGAALMYKRVSYLLGIGIRLSLRRGRPQLFDRTNVG